MLEHDTREEGLRPPPGLSIGRQVWWWFDFIILVKLARLRFIAILAAIGAVIVYWETLHAYYDKWTRPLSGQQQAVGTDSEFWCPMHPTIVRDHDDKCPLCGMPLSKRKKGDKKEAEGLPPGILSRVQLTPYRVAQAGVQMAAVSYLPLVKEIKTVGFVEFDERKLARIAIRAPRKTRIDKLLVNVTGQSVQKGDPLAQVYNSDLTVSVQDLLDARRVGNRERERITRERLQIWGIDNDQIEEILRNREPATQVTIRSPIKGHVIRKYAVEGEYLEEGTPIFDVADLETVWIQAQIYEEDLALVRVGSSATATVSAFPGRKFAGKVAFVFPHLDRASRTVTVRFDVDNPDHELRPGTNAAVTLTVPAANMQQLLQPANEDWAALASAESAVQSLLAPSADMSGASVASALRTAGQQVLFQRGLVLAVPERSVIDTGSQKIVYREYLPNEYEGVLVELGPRMIGPDKAIYYPVLRGLASGERIAVAGSFLIDAETRLSGGAGSTYFGASGGPQSIDKRSTIAGPGSLADDSEAKIKAALAKLSTPDRKLAEEQGYCAVMGSRLGKMGVPVKVIVKGEPVFICCASCKDEALENADSTLAKVKELKAKVKRK